MNPILEILSQTLAKRRKKDPKTLSAKMPDEGFIPYVCHFDPNTILTKNGELMQIIRITGFNNASVYSELISLREALRDSLNENVKETNFAFWFNTIRRKKNITPEGKFPEFLADEVNEIWIHENKLDDQFVNELYITVIIEGIDSSIINFGSFFRSFSYSSIKSLHRKFLTKAHQKLSDLTNKILADVEDYGGKLLGLQEFDDVLYSEPMRFFGKIANLSEDRYPLACNDISNEISNHKTAFGDRELQVVGKNDKNFAAIFSLKEYFEVSTASLDKILQLPIEFIVTQSFDFTFLKKDLENFEYQDYILKVSGDEEFRQASGLANFIENKQGLATDYVKEQITIMILSKTHDGLEKDIAMAFEQFANLGFSAIREDIFLEHCFWSQLPANFHFLKRQKIINSNRVAGFAALHSFPAGKSRSNHWGPAVCALQTVLDTPYFFNFHDGKSGHTSIVGAHDSNQVGILNFLLLQARKFDNKIFYLDLNNSGECLIKALEGAYYNISNRDPRDPEFLHLNPLTNAKNPDFLIEFFNSLIAFSREPIAESEINLIPQIVEKIIANKVSNFAQACELFNNEKTAKIYQKLKILNGDSFKHIFGAKIELNWSVNKIMGFDLTDIFDKKPILIAVVNYLLHQIEAQLDGSKTIIVINEAWQIFNNAFFGKKITQLLQKFAQKNAVVIMTSSDPKSIVKSQVTTAIKEQIVTQIFTPNQEPEPAYEQVFKLSNDELEIVKIMEDEEGHFLLKHGDDSLIISLILEKLEQISRLLNPDQLTLTAMREVIAANSENSKKTTSRAWIEQLLEILQTIDDEEIAAIKEQERQEAIERRKAVES